MTELKDLDESCTLAPSSLPLLPFDFSIELNIFSIDNYRKITMTT